MFWNFVPKHRFFLLKVRNIRNYVPYLLENNYLLENYLTILNKGVIYVKRLLSCNASDFMEMDPQELKQAILASEGRTVCSEMVIVHEPVIHDVTNAEVARAAGADLILLNLLDCLEPLIMGMDGVSFQNYASIKEAKTFNKNLIRDLKKLVCRPIGVNLEPVAEEGTSMLEGRLEIPEGRKCTEATLKAANELGFDFICLTGNPGTGVSNQTIGESIKLAKKYFSGLIIAGKMHSSGVNEPVVTKEAIEEFVENGVDILLVPAVGTVPGLGETDLREIVSFAKEKEILTMSAIGTSQESSRVETIRQIAIENKKIGVDIQHIGDSGYNGMANVENLFEMAIAIRGMRHTLSMIARSINR